MAEQLEILITGVDRVSGVLDQISGKLESTGRAAGEGGGGLGGAFLSLGGNIAIAGAMGIAAITALAGAAAFGMKQGIDVTMRWGEQLEQLNRILGMSGEQATNFAGAMNFVGLSVEEGTAGLSVFVRNLENSKATSAAAGDSFKTAMQDIKDSNRNATDAISEQWTTTQNTATARITQIASDFASKREQIESDLIGRLEDLRARNADALAGKQDDINKNSVRSTEDAEKQKNRALEDLGANATDEQKNQIMLRFNRQIADIAETKKRKEEDLAEEKKRLDAQFADTKERETNKANEQIAQAQRAAEKQTDVVKTELEKQRLIYEAHLKKQEESFQKSQEKLEATFAKQTAANPFEKALARLHLTMKDVQTASGEVNFDKLLDAFNKLPDGLERSSIAMQLFGRGGVKFMEFLSLGSGGIKEMNEWMTRFGLNLSKKQVESINDFSHALNLMGKGFEGIWMQIGIAVMPAFKDLVDYINKNIIPAVVSFAKEHAPKIEAALRGIGDFVGKVIEAFKTGNFDKVFEAIGKAGDKLATAMEPWVNKFWEWLTGPNGVLSKVGTEFIKISDGINKWVQGPAGQRAFKDIGYQIGTAIASIFGFFFEDKSKPIGEGLDRSVKTSGSIFAAVGKAIGEGIYNGIEQYFKDNPIDWFKFITGGYGIGNIRPGFTPGKLPPKDTGGGGFGFASGGIVPGGTGVPQLAIVHGGERVIPVGGRSGGDNIIINFTYAPAVSLATQYEAQNVLQPFIERGILRARQRQIGATS